MAFASVPGIVKVMVDFFTYTDSACTPGTTNSIDVDSRSGSFSLLANISNLICIEPRVHVSLTSKESSVEVHQAPCKNIEMKPFQVEVDLNDPFAIVSEPMPAFDENFSPQNYFINGSMQVEIINATTNATSVTVEICLFTNADDYNGFLGAGENWKNYTLNGNCNSTFVKIGEGVTITNFFSLSKPSFAFLGVASTGSLLIDQLKINATGSNISGIVGSSKVCQLSDKYLTCTVDISVQNGSVCIVAYEEGNPDGTYDYSNLTLNFPRLSKRNPFQTELEAYGFVSLGLLIILIFMLIVTCIVLCKQDNSSFPIEETSVVQQATDSAKSSSSAEDNGRFSRPTASTN